MFLISGTSNSEKALGHAADFCTVCRGAQPFLVFRAGAGDHVYFIPLGRRKTTGHTARCLTCGYTQTVNAMRYASFSRSPGHDLEWLISETFPNLRHFHATRLRMEQQLREGTLPMADREVMFNEIFERFGIAAETQSGGIRLNGCGSLGCLATIIVSLAILIFGSVLGASPEHPGRLVGAAAAVLAVGGILSFLRMRKDEKSGFESKELPKLAAALRPLRPNEVEIDYCTRKMADIGFLVGAKIEPVKLLEAIERETEITRYRG